MSDDAVRDLKRRLLAAALPHVAFDGWGAGLLVRAAGEAGVDAADLPRAFPAGPIDLIDFWLAEADRAMLAELGKLDLAAMKVRERVAAGVRVRLTQQAPHREAVRRAVAFLALPPNVPRGLRGLYRTVDAIWYAAGDTATDWNFYTKRALLAGVYSATVLFWLDDKSEESSATWAFLDRRLADVMQIQKVRGTLDKLVERVSQRWRRQAS